METPPPLAPHQLSGPSKTSKFAVWSLVLGFLSGFLWLLTAIPGLVLGIVGLSKIGNPLNNEKGKGLAITGIVVSSLGLFGILPVLVAGLTVPLIRASVSSGLHTKNEQKMIQLSAACNQYANKNQGSFPESLTELYPDYIDDISTLDANLFGDQKGIFFYHIDLRSDFPAKTILIASPEIGSRRMVARVDGTIEKIGKTEYDKFESSLSLLKIRGDFKTKLIDKEKSSDPIDQPPASEFKIVKYPTKIGEMVAYLSVHKNEPSITKKKPAIIWLTGGLPASSPGSYLWQSTSRDNEQSARIFRQKGIVMMFPLVRGTVADNPGVHECFFGEVEDVIAALSYLQKQKHIDSERIYLGGHSTGGTLALLCAAASDGFAGVISLGPTSDHYGEMDSPFEWTPTEINMRAPINYVNSVRIPTYVIEGEDGNMHALRALKTKNKNSKVQFVEISGEDHFSIIHPVNYLFAEAILKSKDGDLGLTTLDIQNSCQNPTQSPLR